MHGQAHPAEAAHGAAGHRGRALDGGEVLRQVVHLQVLRPGEVLVGQRVVDGVALRAVQREVALGLLEGGVAAVAGGEQVETGAADDGEVAGGDQVVQVRVAGLHQRALGAAGVTLELVRLHAQVLEHEARGLLDRREARGDRASPEHRVVPHAASYLTSSPLRSSVPGTETLPDRDPAESRRGAPLLPVQRGTSSCRRACRGAVLRERLCLVRYASERDSGSLPSVCGALTSGYWMCDRRVGRHACRVVALVRHLCLRWRLRPALPGPR